MAFLQPYLLWGLLAMAVPVAIHFWYDVLVEAVDFIADPKNSPLAMRIGWSF